MVPSDTANRSKTVNQPSIANLKVKEYVTIQPERPFRPKEQNQPSSIAWVEKTHFADRRFLRNLRKHVSNFKRICSIVDWGLHQKTKAIVTKSHIRRYTDPLIAIQKGTSCDRIDLTYFGRLNNHWNPDQRAPLGKVPSTHSPLRTTSKCAHQPDK